MAESIVPLRKKIKDRLNMLREVKVQIGRRHQGGPHSAIECVNQHDL